jgi:ribosome-associated protein
MDADQQKVQDLARQLARVAADNRCEDVVVMDLRGLTNVADYFVVCSGTSDRQMRAAAEELLEHGRSVNEPAFSATGMETATWIVVDFIHVVVHIFTPEYRSYYDLELLWGDAPRVEWSREGVPESAAEVSDNGFDDGD